MANYDLERKPDRGAERDLERAEAHLMRREHEPAPLSETNRFAVYLQAHRDESDADGERLLSRYADLLEAKTAMWKENSAVFMASTGVEVAPFGKLVKYGEALEGFLAATGGELASPFQVCMITQAEERRLTPMALTRWFGSAYSGRDRIVQELVIWALSYRWSMSSATRSRALSLVPQRTKQGPMEDIELPSSSAVRHGLDVLGADEFDLSITWCQPAPRYSSDANVRIWVPHHHPAPLQTLHIRFFAQVAVDGLPVRRAVVATQSRTTVENVRRGYRWAVKTAHDRGLELSSKDYSWLFVSAALVQAIKDILQFTRISRRQISAVSLAGRRAPSSSKIQFLCHLEDTQQVTIQCCDNLLRLMSQWEPHVPTVIGLDFGFEAGSKDVAFLRGQIIENRARIIKAKKLLHEQLDIRTRWWVRVGQFLVSIYVPLAFMTSFFSMNLQYNANNSASLLDGLLKATEATANVSTAPAVMNFQATLQNGTPSSADAWSMALFFWIAAPLAVGTIVVPLVAPTVMYRLVRVSRRLTWSDLCWLVLWVPVLFSIGLVLAMALTRQHFPFQGPYGGGYNASNARG